MRGSPDDPQVRALVFLVGSLLISAHIVRLVGLFDSWGPYAQTVAQGTATVGLAVLILVAMTLVWAGVFNVLDRLQSDDRARITPPDVVLGLASLAFLGALVPVFYDSLGKRVGSLGQGELMLFQLVVPGVILVFLSMVYVKATAGAR